MAAAHAPSSRRPAGLFSAAPFFAVFLFLLAVAYVPGLDQPGRVPREALLLVGAPLLLGLSLFLRRSHPSNLFLALMGVALVSGIAHVLLADGPERLAVARDLAILVAPWCVALAVTLSVGDRERFDGAIEGAAMIALIAVGLLGLAQAWLGWSIVEQRGPPAATFINRNVAAQTLVALIPLVIPVLLAGRTTWIRRVATVSAAIGVAYLVATRTRGAWLGVLVGAALGAVLLISRREKLPSIRQAALPLALVLGFGLVAVFVPVYKAPGETLPSVGERLSHLTQPFHGSGVIRRALIENTAVMAVENPLGVGPGRYSVVYPLYHAARRPTYGFGTEFQAQHTHNDLLEYVVEFGLPAALALVLLCVGGVVLSCGRTPNGSPRDLYRDVARAAALTGILVHGMVSFPLHSPASAFLGFLLLGRCWARPERTCTGSSTTRLLAILVLATLPFAVWIGYREIRSQSALYDARHARAAQECAGALEHADKVFEQAPWQRRDVGMAAMIRFECTSDSASSLTALERARALHPHRLELLLATGARRMKAGRPADAEPLFLHAAEIFPGHARAWLGLAMARLSLGNRTGAAEGCAQALQLEPDLAPARTFCIGNGLI